MHRPLTTQLVGSYTKPAWLIRHQRVTSLGDDTFWRPDLEVREQAWDDATRLAISEQERGKIYQEYLDFTASIKKSGHWLAGDPLERTAAATTVRVRNGKPMATDGPFAETREQLGGYYMVDAKDLDAAIAIAARIPGARIGSIEVRPVWVYN